MRKKITCILLLLCGIHSFLFAQLLADPIREAETARIIRVLASDSMKGRGNGRPELLDAAIFIGEQFRAASLQPMRGFPGYFIPFRPFGGSRSFSTDELIWNGKALPRERFRYIHPAPGNYAPRDTSGFLIMRMDSLPATDSLHQLLKEKKDLLLWAPGKQEDIEAYFGDKAQFPLAGLQNNILIASAEEAPSSIRLSGSGNYYSHVEYNVVACLPGRSRPNEIVLFSAHYDHEGVYGRRRRDSIMNGANDNASGTTALLQLATYFARKNNNERTLLFCAFAGEELGLKGSEDFMQYIEADEIIAGINLEMLGVPQYGRKRVFITGESYSSLPDILREGLIKNSIRVTREPDPEKNLFMRSDNFPLAQKGIPAHTIMASDDDDKCYHQPCDEVKRIDIPNLAAITRAIAKACGSLINGEETPTRVDRTGLMK